MLQKTPRISQDVHVEPFWKRCDVCNLNYDIIGKMETFTKDSNYILENTGMNASKINVEEKVHVSSGDPTEKLAKDLFSKLPKELIEQLYELYKIDFEMFDYKYKDYIIS